MSNGDSFNSAAPQPLQTFLDRSDIDEFAGSWSAAEAAEFDCNLAAMRRVDPLDWKL